MPKVRKAAARAVPPQTAPPSRRVPFAIVAVVLVTVLAFSSALRGKLFFDDLLSIQNNPTITQLWPPSIPLNAPVTTPLAGRPFSNYSMALNYGLNSAFGIDQRPDPDGPDKTIGYHVVNIVFHLLCGLLLFGVIRRTLRTGQFGDRWARDGDGLALFVAAVWLVHPIHTDAVDYLTERSEVLVSLCYLATLYSSIRAWDTATARARNRWYVAGTVACFLGMGSKEVMATAPLMVILYDRAFRLKSWREFGATELRSRRWFYGALFGTLLFLVRLIAAGTHGAEFGYNRGATWYEYLNTQGWAIPHYLRLVFWPDRLNADYGRYLLPLWQGAPGLVFLTVLGAITILAWIRIDRWGWLAFAGAWFFIILAPSSSIVPLINEAAAERRIYLALAAVLVVVAVSAHALIDRVASATRHSANAVQDAGDWSPGLQRGVWLSATVLVVLLALLTFQRGRLYLSPEAMWRDAAAKQPTNGRAWTNLGAALPADRSAEADSFFRRAIAVDSTFAGPRYDLAVHMMQQGELADAEHELQQAVSIDPKYGPALAALTTLLLARGDAAGALRYLAPAADSTLDGPLLINLGEAYLGTGRAPEAEAAFRRALAQEPARVDAARLLGGLLAEEGRPAEAVPLLERVVIAQPHSGMTLAMLSFAYASLGRGPEAVVAANRAVQQSDADMQVYFFAGRAVLEAGHAELAESDLARAVALQPRDPDVLTSLGMAKSKLGKNGEAIELFRRALSIDPNDGEARDGLSYLTSGTPRPR